MTFTTRGTLLERLQANDRRAWEEFYKYYEPMVAIYAYRNNLTSSEGEELKQIVMTEFAKTAQEFKYDRNIGRFRGYFSGLIRNQTVNLVRSRPPEVALDDAIARAYEEQNQCEIESFEISRDEWRQIMWKHILTLLEMRVEKQTFEAFCLYVLQGRDVDDVASYLNMTPNQVYVSKARCVRILRKLIHYFRRHDSEQDMYEF